MRQVKVRILGELAAAGTNKTVLTRAPVDSVAAPGFSGEGGSCRTVIVRTEGPVPAKVSCQDLLGPYCITVPTGNGFR